MPQAAVCYNNYYLSSFFFFCVFLLLNGCILCSYTQQTTPSGVVGVPKTCLVLISTANPYAHKQLMHEYATKSLFRDSYMALNVFYLLPAKTNVSRNKTRQKPIYMHPIVIMC